MLGWEDTTSILLPAAAFPLSLVLTRFFMSFNSSRGIFGVDVHKMSKPKIPEMCGAALPITLIVLAGAYGIFHPVQVVGVVAFCLVIGFAGVVGAVDDWFRLRGVYKPLLMLFCGLPLAVLGLLFPGQVYSPTLKVPLFGGFHLPVIYPLSILVAISVTSNAVNMLDPLNGTMAGGIAIISTGLLVGLSVKSPGSIATFLFGIMLFSSLGFFYYNRYPSRAFSGNVGQLSIGAALGATAIMGRVEIATIVAMFPHIQNSFFFLSRIKRFTEHREVAAKPTKLLDDGRLASSEDPNAPLTLVRTMLVGNPATEAQVVNRIFALFSLSTALAIITLLLTR